MGVDMMTKTYRVLNIISSLIGEIYENEDDCSSGLMEFLEELEDEVTESIDSETPLTDYCIIDTLHEIAGMTFYIEHEEDNQILKELFNKIDKVLNE